MGQFGIGLYVKNSVEAAKLYMAAFGMTLGYHVLNDDGSYFHSELCIGDDGLAVVESDAPVGGNPVELGFTFESREALEKAFALLREGGEVKRDMGPLPWSPCAASVIDRYGVNWYLTLRQHRPLEIKYIPNGEMSEKARAEVKRINETCLSGNSGDPAAVEADMYDWEAPEDGMFLLMDGDVAVGRVAVHKVTSEYAGRRYCLGGFGGLAVLPEYRGAGYGRKLAESALAKAREIGVDVACMCVNTDSGITDFYARLGYRFLGRPARFTSWANRQKTDETVMLMGLNDPALAEEILSTDGVFHYGDIKGHW